MAEKKYPSESQDRFIVRFPDDEMRARIAREAAANGRSMNAEIVGRLQTSFDQPDGDIRTLQTQLNEQRELTRQFQVVADMCDHFRSISTRMLLLAAERLPKTAKSDLLHPLIEEDFIEWLNERDARGAAFSVLRLLDHSDDEKIAKLREFVTALEARGYFKQHSSGAEQTNVEPFETRLVRGRASAFKAALRSDGTLAVLGDPEIIKTKLRAAGVSKFIPMKGGICIGLSQVEKALEVFPLADPAQRLQAKRPIPKK